MKPKSWMCLNTKHGSGGFMKLQEETEEAKELLRALQNILKDQTAYKNISGVAIVR
ncbi:MAG: hypothetical protein U5K54_16850 [Cytophagales bacterium]|nr:hypothetical protein [Cytophagales bacterium]